MIPRLLFPVSAAAALACQVAPVSAEDPAVAAGQAIVEANCATCHAVAATDEGTHPQAPAFRTLSEHYPVADLAEALAEGIMVGHPDMPQFVATPEEIAAIIAYLESIQE